MRPAVAMWEVDMSQLSRDNGTRTDKVFECQGPLERGWESAAYRRDYAFTSL